ncbi:hypothetical protein GLAREA_08595 [Glarea lozoyensis ATCC 20868]|uniref:Uncharacterized protein n=1 Tax=Glarea lozoyensis (strain ATCC 20868 / MF5171) TaxID=1116229 RepID=S3CE16_GLAL2|nr:uncharacterized protein GLAREA_08595 [Glarea lozoyensis ATCC 20868]EPE24742.1 hypothetical protein GLAREA_08595 [Glarea lozoyensis ATCC 20868]
MTTNADPAPPPFKKQKREPKPKPPNKAGSEKTFAGNKTKECAKFDTLLRAVYNMPYEIAACHEIFALTEIANYYGMLRSLSASITGPIVSNKVIGAFLEPLAEDMLPRAVKLRNKALYKECLIYCLGPYNEPRYDSLKDHAKIYLSAEKVYQRLSVKVSQRLQDILENVAREFSPEWEEDQLKKLIKAIVKSRVIAPEDDASIPEFFRNLEGQNDFYDCGCCHDLLDNQLVFNIDAVAGKGGFREYFLVADLEEEDYPWDTKEMDW